MIYLALAAQEHAARVIRPPWIWIRTLPRAPESALISPSRRAFPCNESFAPAGIPSARRNQVSPDGQIMAAPKGSPEGRGLDLPRRLAAGGHGHCREMRRCTEMLRLELGRSCKNGPEYLPAFHDSSPEGVMPKAFPVIDPEAPVSDIMSQSSSITTHLKTPD
jgi:hypothetical protein